MSCYNCKDRFVNAKTNERCHDSCEKYKVFRDKMDVVKQNRYKRNDINGYMIESCIKSKRAMNR